jgi:hypothetical protein
MSSFLGRRKDFGTLQSLAVFASPAKMAFGRCNSHYIVVTAYITVRLTSTLWTVTPFDLRAHVRQTTTSPHPRIAQPPNSSPPRAPDKWNPKFGHFVLAHQGKANSTYSLNTSMAPHQSSNTTPSATLTLKSKPTYGSNHLGKQPNDSQDGVVNSSWTSGLCARRATTTNALTRQLIGLFSPTTGTARTSSLLIVLPDEFGYFLQQANPPLLPL